MKKDGSNPPELKEEVIRERAYQLYEERGSQPGHELDDWLQAEAEMLSKKPARTQQRTPRAAVVAA